MRTFLLNIGFIEITPGTYYNNEVELEVHIVLDVDGNEILKVPTPMGNKTATIEELEDAIVAGGFGDF
jgi:hypothetical protein